METLLTALGRSDNAAAAMKVLGPHAGKVKQAKEAATWREMSADRFRGFKFEFLCALCSKSM